MTRGMSSFLRALGGFILTILLIIGIGFGLMMAVCGGGGAALIIIPILIVVIPIYRKIMKSLFRGKKDGNQVNITPEKKFRDRNQKAIVQYIVETRAGGLLDQDISAELLGVGWTADDINNAFGFLK